MHIDKKLDFKNNTPFISCISKINDTLIDNAEDLDLVMPMYNLFEYSKNYLKTSRSLWNYYRDEPNSGAEGDVDHSIKNSKSFDYKANITGKLGDSKRTKDVKSAIPLKYLSSIWRTLNMPLISCEVSLTLIWSENCALTSKETRNIVPWR